MQTPRLFMLLPEEYVSTPDGMEIDREGNLILSCPNFADMSMPSCIVKIGKDKSVRKWFDVPKNPATGEAISTSWTTPAGPAGRTFCSPGASCGCAWTATAWKG